MIHTVTFNPPRDRAILVERLNEEDTTRVHSQTKEFCMGRITNKIVYMAKGLAVWVVS